MANDHWEYHVTHSEEPLSEDQLNHLGAQGWELVAAMPTGGHYIFKRITPGLSARITLEQRDALEADRDEEKAG